MKNSEQQSNNISYESNNFDLNSNMATIEKTKFYVDTKDNLLDFKILMKDFYSAKFNGNGKELHLELKNGQKFIISVDLINN